MGDLKREGGLAVNLGTVAQTWGPTSFERDVSS